MLKQFKERNGEIKSFGLVLKYVKEGKIVKRVWEKNAEKKIFNKSNNPNDIVWLSMYVLISSSLYYWGYALWSCEEEKDWYSYSMLQQYE